MAVLGGQRLGELGVLATLALRGLHRGGGVVTVQSQRGGRTRESTTAAPVVDLAPDTRSPNMVRAGRKPARVSRD